MTGAPSRDRQQALVLGMLRGARGAPVSFSRLQEAGVEFPASVVVELELAGVAVDRCRIETTGRRPAPAVRLDPDRDPANQPPTDRGDGSPPEPIPAGAAPAVSAPARRAARRWTAAAAALALAGALAAGAILGSSGPAAVRRPATRPGLAARPEPHGVASTVPPATHRPAPARRRRRTRARTTQVHRSPPPPVSLAEASTLDIRGHDLLLGGRYGTAIATLRAAMAATGEDLAACRQPTSETCLVYGYALYDIGQALLLGGHPAAAVPVFERRLLIDNQIPVVEAALALARARAA